MVVVLSAKLLYGRNGVLTTREAELTRHAKSCEIVGFLRVQLCKAACD